jgi:hypothetical protein
MGFPLHGSTFRLSTIWRMGLTVRCDVSDGAIGFQVILAYGIKIELFIRQIAEIAID